MRLLAIAAALGSMVGAAAAQDYPTRPINVIVPAAAGGPTIFLYSSGVVGRNIGSVGLVQLGSDMGEPALEVIAVDGACGRNDASPRVLIGDVLYDRLLYALIVLGLDRRRIIHFDVTQNPTQVWLSRQMTEAFPWDTAPRYLLRDRDKSYGPAFRDRVQAMGIREVVTAPRSPWQNPCVERLIGSIRRECLDHIIIFNERHLRRVLSSYFQYHHGARTHLSSTRIARSLVAYSLPLQATLSSSRRSAVCIIATNVAPRDP